MAKDKVTNRIHNLGATPPKRRDRRMPRMGCQPCIEQAAGSCPYRTVAYKCGEPELELGRALGFCVIEVAQRHAKHEEIAPLLDYLQGDRREEGYEALELFLDVYVYSQRASAWTNQVMLAGEETREAHFDRALCRYKDAASERLLYRIQKLRPFLVESHEARDEARFEAHLAQLALASTRATA